VTAAAPIALTAAQADRLRFVAGARRVGEVRAARDPILLALGRRDLLVAQDCGQSPRRCRWVATMTGRAWIIADDTAKGFVPSVPVAANGNELAAMGSRWTERQLRALAREGVEHPERCRVAFISQPVPAHEDDWTLPLVRRRVAVPRLTVTRDGRRAKVIFPTGAVTWTEVAHG